MTRQTEQTGLTPVQKLGVLSFFVCSCLFHLRTYGLTDDHFDRISRGRQIAQYGELPFKDFFDPGYFLTLFTSAAAQWIFGDSLLGEALINIVGLSLGFSFTLIMLIRVIGGLPLALLLTTFAVSIEPRFYDYDKVLFYSLGLLLCWRYADKPSLINLALLSSLTALAFWFRYDNGVYLACAGLVTLLALHTEKTVFLHRLGTFALGVTILSFPPLIFLQANGGVGDYIGQIGSYASREGRRTDLFRMPRITIDSTEPWFAIASRPSYPIKIRWAEGLSELERSTVERRYDLKAPLLDGDRTWEYQLEDPSTQRIGSLIAEPYIEDTGLIDRGTQTVPAAESLAGTIERFLFNIFPPLRIQFLPGIFSSINRVAFYYYLCLLIPALALFVIWKGKARQTDVPHQQADSARGLCLVTLCLLVDAFILRSPIEARIGAIGPSLTLLAAWTTVRLFPMFSNSLKVTRPLRSIVCVLSLCICGPGLLLSLSSRLGFGSNSLRSPASVLQTLAQTPPSEVFLPRGGQAELIRYVRSCTKPEDKLLATWFAPHLFAMSGRGFGGGMLVFFGGHWSSISHQRQIIAKLSSESVPLVIVDKATVSDFEQNYQLVNRHLQRTYRLARESSFGDPEVSTDGYQVLVQRELSPTGRYDSWGLPCFQ